MTENQQIEWINLDKEAKSRVYDKSWWQAIIVDDPKVDTTQERS